MTAGGLGSQVGFAEETTFGTIATPTRFFELTQESVKYNRERIKSQGLRAGRRVADKWVPGRQGGSGDVEFEIQPNGFAIFAKHMLGAIATTTPVGGTTARLHTATVGPIDGKSLTTQFGRANETGTVDPYTYSGSKITDWELDMDSNNGVLSAKLSLDVANEDTATALAAATFPTTNVLLPFSDANTSITIGGTTYDIDKVSLSGKNSLATDLYKLGSAAKREQLEGAGLREYTGTIDLTSYKGLTPYNLFVNGTEAAIVSTFSGALIEGTLHYMVRVTMPRCIFNGDTPNIGGAQLLAQSLPFEALYSTAATTSVQIEVQNTDVTP